MSFLHILFEIHTFTRILEPVSINGLTLNLDASYYSSNKSFREVAENVSQINVSEMLSNLAGGMWIDDFSFTGWAIDVIDSINVDFLGKRIVHQSNDVNPGFSNSEPFKCYIRFTLQENYYTPSEIDSLTIQDDGIYYSEISDWWKVDAVSITDFATYIPNQFAELRINIFDLNGTLEETFEGWDYEIVGGIGSITILKTLITRTQYALKYTLKDGIDAPADMTGFSLNDNGSYYTIEKPYLLTSEFENDIVENFETKVIINPVDASTNQPYNGWTIDLAGPGLIPLESLAIGEEYLVIFKLNTGYTNPVNVLSRNDLVATDSGDETYEIKET